MKGSTSTPSGAPIARRCWRHGGETFPALSDRWGTVVPLGEYPRHRAWVATSPAAPSGFSVASLVSRRTIFYAVEVVTVDRARSGGGGGRLVLSVRIRTASSGGPTPAAVAGTSGLSPATGSVRLMRRGAIQSGCCRRAPARSRPSGRMGVGRSFDRAAFRRLLDEPRPVGRGAQRPADPGTALWTLLELHRAAGRKDHHPRPDHRRGRRRAADRGAIVAASATGFRRPRPELAATVLARLRAQSVSGSLRRRRRAGVSSKVKDALLTPPAHRRQAQRRLRLT